MICGGGAQQCRARPLSLPLAFRQILVLAHDEHVGAACNLHRGCIPFKYPRPDEAFDTDTRFAYGLGAHGAL